VYGTAELYTMESWKGQIERSDRGK
jgi:hypothetical protein